MGLDMYLETVPKNKVPKNLDQYIEYSDASWHSNEQYEEPLIDWRKANQIHNWFCAHCESIEEEILYKVTLEDLTQLCKTIEEVLKNHKKARALLPTCAGFFYGSTEYGEWYFDELVFTQKKLTELFKTIEDTDLLQEKALLYYASW